MDKPCKEVFQDLQNHQAWLWWEQEIQLKMEKCKDNLLLTDNITDVKRLQTEYDTYKSILKLVNKP